MIKGIRLEKYLEAMHQVYKNKKLADISKKEVKKAFDKKTGEVRYLKKEGFDFEGCVRGGRSIAIEAKEGQKNLYVDPKGKRGLKLHQLRALLLRGELGGLSCVIWMPDNNNAYLLDYSFLKHFYEEVYTKERMSISLKSVEEKCPNVMSSGMIDYLEKIQESKEGK